MTQAFFPSYASQVTDVARRICEAVPTVEPEECLRQSRIFMFVHGDARCKSLMNKLGFED